VVESDAWHHSVVYDIVHLMHTIFASMTLSPFSMYDIAAVLIRLCMIAGWLAQQGRMTIWRQQSHKSASKFTLRWMLPCSRSPSIPVFGVSLQ
jgi:hypothetical protein